MAQLEIKPSYLGELEVGWWKAHNENNRAEMFRCLVEQNMALFGFDQSEAEVALQYLLEGVKFHNARDWDNATETVAHYYQKVKDKTGLAFEPHIVAELEVNWWRLHDELEKNPDKSPLASAFTRLYATIFGIDEQTLIKAGELKAEATREHDLAENPQTPVDETEVHWDKARQLLVGFYSELQQALE